MSAKKDRLFAAGLKASIGGGAVMRDVDRSGFSLKSSHFESEDGVYHDEWLGDRAGGGQETGSSGKTTFTRVYAGGTIPDEELKKLGISKSDVMAFLGKQITENGERIRLDADFEPEPDGSWQYSYKVLESDREISLTLGKEVIKYKGQIVFIHDFIISPVD